MSSVKDRLAKLRAQNSSQSQGGAGQEQSSEQNVDSGQKKTRSTSERLAALRENKKRLSTKDSSNGGGRFEDRKSKILLNRQGKDPIDIGSGAEEDETDEGSTTDDTDLSYSDIDEEGNPLLSEKEKIKNFENDPRFMRPVVMIRNPRAMPLAEISFSNIPCSVSAKAEPHIAYPGGFPTQENLSMRNMGEVSLVDEGFFVPRYPNAANKPRFTLRILHQNNLRRVENRLHREITESAKSRVTKLDENEEAESTTSSNDQETEEQKVYDEMSKVLFNQDGLMVALEDPTKRIITRPVDADPLLLDMEDEKFFSTYIGHSGTGNLSALASGSDAIKVAGMVVDVHSLIFSEHPLFIQEDVLASKLRTMFRQYQRLIRVDELKHLTEHLQALINKAEALKNETDKQDIDQTVWDATKHDILNTFSKRLSVELEMRELIRDIYNIWIELKQIRISQDFTSTNVKLTVLRAESSFSTEYIEKQVNYVRKIAGEIANEKTENSISHAAEKANDLIKMYEMTRSNAENTLEKKRKKKKKDKNSLSCNSTANYILRLTEDIPFTKDEEVSKVELQRRNSIRNSRIYVKLYVNGFLVARTRKVKLSWPTFSAEFRRKFNLELCERPRNIKLEIKGSSSTSSSYIYSTIATIPVPIPAANLTQVLADSVGPDNRWHQFSSDRPIPTSRWRWEKPKPNYKTLREVHYESQHKHNLSENTQTISNISERFTTGMLHVCVVWSPSMDNRDSEKKVGDVGLPEHSKNIITGRLIGKCESDLAGGAAAGGNNVVSSEALAYDDEIPDFANEVDFQALIEELHELDPNDPRNAGVLRLIESLQGYKSRGNLFRSEAMMIDALFPTANIRRYKVSNRVKLLKLRTSKGHLFQQPIPANDAEIRNQEALQALLIPEDSRFDDQGLKSSGSSQLNKLQMAKRAKINDFVSRVKKSQKGESGSNRVKEIPVSSVVKEDVLPAFSLNLEFLSGLFTPRRKLKPVPKARKSASLSVTSANIFIQLVRAQSVPVRKSATDGTYPSSPGRSPMNRSPTKDGNDDDEENVMEGNERVMSFIQARFQGTSRRTSAQEGPAPTWNESLFLPFIPPRNDFSPANLKSIRDELYLNLFDEVLVDGEPDNYREEEMTFQRREKRYLGYLSIPFSTIYLNGKVEGLFRVESPPINLGYINRTRGSKSGFSEEGEFDNEYGNSGDKRLKDEAANATYVYLMATLDPKLTTPDDNADLNLSGYSQNRGENQKISKQARQWVANAKSRNARTANANIQALVNDINGNEVFMPRYISPQVPPTDKTGKELDSVEKIVRFVSLIPFLDDWQAFSDSDNDVWNTSQEFLDLCAGDWEEHAVLLCNFLLWLKEKISPNIDVYLVLGSGIPEGDTVYVMVSDRQLSDVNENEGIVFWNASTGSGYVASDKKSPLRDVAMIVNENNMWANVQEFGEPHKLKWNLKNSKEWIPFWGENVSKTETPTPTVQTRHLSYAMVDKNFAQYLEGELTDQIQRSIRRWRSKRGTTRFNNLVSRRLKQLLKDMETMKSEGRKTLHTEHSNALKETEATNKLIGFPLNMTFTEVNAVIRAVKNTDIHNMVQKDVQYALAVLVVPYTNNICSIWVYPAAIINSR